MVLRSSSAYDSFTGWSRRTNTTKQVRVLAAKVLLFSIALSSGAVACTSDPSADRSTRVPDAGSPVPSSTRAGDPTANLRQLLLDFSSNTFTVTYAADPSGLGDEPGAPSAIALTIAQKGERSRTTFLLTGGGAENSLTTFLAPDMAVLCSEDVDPFFSFLPIGDPLRPIGDHECIDASDAFGGVDALAKLNFIDEIKQQKMTVTEVTSRNINGMPATCYQVEQDDDEAEHAILCWSAEGRLVSMEDKGGSGRYTLTEFTEGVPDNAFELPYPISNP